METVGTKMGMAGNIPVNATVVDPSTKTVHREVPAMICTIRLIEGRIDRRSLIPV